MFAPSAALGFQFTVWETLLVVIIGGMFGISFFYLGAETFMSWMNRRKLKKEAEKRAKGIVVEKKVFTPFRRRVIRIKNKFGIIGIAIVTPCIISIPIGSILAARLFQNKVKVLTAMFISVVAWAFILTFLNEQVMKLLNLISS